MTCDSLLLVEDDEKLMRLLLELAQAAGWKTLSARCVDEAIESAREHSAEIRVALIDLMIPTNVGQFEELNKFQKQRWEIQQREQRGRVLGQEFTEEELLKLRDELRGLDADIEGCINLDGGAVFLREAKQHGWSTAWKLAIFTSAAPPAPLDPLEFVDDKDNWLGLWPKPLKSDTIRDKLISLKAQMTR